MFPIVSSVFFALLYVLSEWLFFATKVSFLSQVSLIGKVLILLRTISLVNLCILLPVIFIYITTKIINRSSLSFLNLIIPSLIFTSLIFTLINNFIHTIFNISAFGSIGISKILYCILLICFFIYSYYKLKYYDSVTLILSKRKLYKFLVVPLCILMCISFVLNINFLRTQNDPSDNFKNNYNVIFLASDAVDAKHMSLYGYERNTTPFLDSQRKKLLIFENAFANVNNSSGSIVTLLSGRSPLVTRLSSYPEILDPIHAYKHLPKILKDLGYYNFEIGIKNWADAADLNIKDSFSVSNGINYDNIFNRTIKKFPKFYSSYDFYFLSQMKKRLAMGIGHVLRFNNFSYAYHNIVNSNFSYKNDHKNLNSFLNKIEKLDKPFFAHLHLLGTHGPCFSTRENTFDDQSNACPNNGSYDDAIRDFDYLVKKLFVKLGSFGKLNNTIIVVHSDHSSRYDTRDRIPLMFFFPDNRFVGRLVENAQLSDVTPTILSYMGVAIPNWMTGRNLTKFTNSGSNQILTVDSKWPFTFKSFQDTEYRTISKINLISCQRYHSFDLAKNELVIGEIEDYVSNCKEENLPPSYVAYEIVLSKLKKYGYSQGAISRFKKIVSKFDEDIQD